MFLKLLEIPPLVISFHLRYLVTIRERVCHLPCADSACTWWLLLHANSAFQELTKHSPSTSSVLVLDRWEMGDTGPAYVEFPGLWEASTERNLCVRCSVERHGARERRKALPSWGLVGGRPQGGLSVLRLV